MKGLAEKTTNKEIKHIRSINYLLVFMVFQMSIYLSQEILGSEILKRVLFSINILVVIGVFIGSLFYLIFKNLKNQK
ncbi:MAG: hypothetical protein ACP5HI_05900 [Caldimicrobium sp.]